jgi:midasin (ATPase involved in ribosome maturation)
VPELGMSFQVQHEKTKIFGCQNPFRQGGGRKGLPRSFLNRFTQVRFTVATKTKAIYGKDVHYVDE